MARKTAALMFLSGVFTGQIAYGVLSEHSGVAVVGGAGMVLVAAAAALDVRGW